jgi:hypothetical protein
MGPLTVSSAGVAISLSVTEPVLRIRLFPARPARRKFSNEFLPMSRTDAALETLLACRPQRAAPGMTA